jgi:membrane protein implicated in regulation of membrane protease activity
MPGGADLGRMLLILGGFLCLLGLLLLLSSKIPWLGRLPGDIHIQRGNWSCSFPLVTSLVLSLLLTVLLNLILRLWRK